MLLDTGISRQIVKKMKCEIGGCLIEQIDDLLLVMMRRDRLEEMFGDSFPMSVSYS